MGKKIKKSKTVSSSVCRVHKSKNFNMVSRRVLSLQRAGRIIRQGNQAGAGIINRDPNGFKVKAEVMICSSAFYFISPLESKLNIGV